MNLCIRHDIIIKMDGHNVPANLALTIDDPPTDATVDDIMDALQATFAGDHSKENGAAQHPPSSAHHLLGESWKPPEGMHGRAWKTVHRILKGVYDATQNGKAATAKDIQERTKISLVPIYNAMKPDTPTGKYAAKYLLVGEQGRNKSLDLTKEGSLLVSLMRAGKVPY